MQLPTISVRPQSPAFTIAAPTPSEMTRRLHTLGSLYQRRFAFRTGSSVESGGLSTAAIRPSVFIPQKHGTGSHTIVRARTIRFSSIPSIPRSFDEIPAHLKHSPLPFAHAP